MPGRHPEKDPQGHTSHEDLNAPDRLKHLKELVLALIAMDAPPASYLANAPAGAEAGLTAADIQGVMIAVAPVVGTPRVVAAGGHILRALGLAIAVDDAEMASQIDG